MEASSGNPQGVAYRAVDGGLIVVCGGSEFLVPLEGWSMEEVGSIVVSIQQADWIVFHDVMSWSLESQVGLGRPVSRENQALQGGSVSYGSTQEVCSSLQPAGNVNPEIEEPSELAPTVGSDDSEVLPDLEPLHPVVSPVNQEALRAACWFIAIVHLALGSLSLVGACRGAIVALASLSDERSFGLDAALIEAVQAPSLGIGDLGVWLFLFAWLTSCWHQLGAMLEGLDVSWEFVLVSIPGYSRPVSISCLEGRWVLWLLMVLLLGFCGPTEAYVGGDGQRDQGQVQVWQAGLMAVQELQVCSEPEVPEDDRVEWFQETFKAVCVVATWEFLKRMMCRRRRQKETVGSQTSSTRMVPLPLEAGVPHRAQILFCLWRAGYEVEVQDYPENIQEEYFSFQGNFLRRQAVGEEFSDTSSGNSG